MKLEKDLLKDIGAVVIKARDNAYAPYSNHPVGSVLISAEGNVYAGANCELANLDCTCAEQSAIASMITAGDRLIRYIAVAGPGKSITPCGRCRQRISEFADKKTRVLIYTSTGRYVKSYTIETLLPYAFNQEKVTKNG